MLCYLRSFVINIPLNGNIGKNNKSLLGINDYIFIKSWSIKDINTILASISIDTPNYLGLSIESGTLTVNGKLSASLSADCLIILAVADASNTVIKWEGKYKGLLEGKGLFGRFAGDIDYVLSSRLGDNLTYSEYKKRRKQVCKL